MAERQEVLGYLSQRHLVREEARLLIVIQRVAGGKVSSRKKKFDNQAETVVIMLAQAFPIVPFPGLGISLLSWLQTFWGKCCPTVPYYTCNRCCVVASSPLFNGVVIDKPCAYGIVYARRSLVRISRGIDIWLTNMRSKDEE